MEDLSNDMRPGKPVSAKLRAMLDKEKASTRKRIVERGIVHFRADQQFMEALLEAADELKTAPGTMCRQIVWEYLKARRSSSPSGKTMDMAKADVNQALFHKLELLECEIKEIHSCITGKDWGTQPGRKSVRRSSP